MRKCLIPVIYLLAVVISASCSMNNYSGAIFYAKKIVKEGLVSPTTATFDNEKVLERDGNLFLVYMTVDAQNYFGAKIRKHYLVVLEVLPNGTHYYSRTGAAQELDEPPNEITIYATKLANGWDSWKQHQD
jgi:hypothetical protein